MEGEVVEVSPRSEREGGYEQIMKWLDFTIKLSQYVATSATVFGVILQAIRYLLLR